MVCKQFSLVTGMQANFVNEEIYQQYYSLKYVSILQGMEVDVDNDMIIFILYRDK